MTTKSVLSAAYLPGFNPKFVTQSLTPNLLCAFCGGVALSTMKDANNHSFCYECIYNNNCICPIEKKKVEIKEANDEREIIKNLHTRCENQENGCPWDGLYKAYNNHIYSQCTKVKVHCKHEGCPMEVDRESLRLHMASCKFRLFECPDCKSSIKVKAKEKHAKVCPNRKIDCPNNCGAKINKSELQAHLHECSGTGNIQLIINKTNLPQAMNIPTEGDIVCPLARLGCNQKHNQAYIDNINAFREGHYQYFEAMVSYFIAEDEKEQKMKKKQEKEIEKKESEKEKELEKKKKDVDIAPEVESPKKKKSKEDKENKPVIKDDKVIGKKRAKPLILDEEAPLEKANQPKPQTKDEIICTSKVEQSPVHIVIDKDKSELRKDGVPSIKPQIDSMVFDTTNKFKDIEVQGPIAKFTSLAPSRHRKQFLLAKRDIDITFRDSKKGANVYKWKVIIHNYSKWLAFGLCDKELVKRNNYSFGVRDDLPAFLLTTENILYSMNKKENRKKSLLSRIQKKAEFILEYFVDNYHLIINYEKESAILNGVKPVGDNVYLTPCFVFYEAAEVEMEYL